MCFTCTSMSNISSYAVWPRLVLLDLRTHYYDKQQIWGFRKRKGRAVADTRNHHLRIMVIERNRYTTVWLVVVGLNCATFFGLLHPLKESSCENLCWLLSPINHFLISNFLRSFNENLWSGLNPIFFATATSEFIKLKKVRSWDLQNYFHLLYRKLDAYVLGLIKLSGNGTHKHLFSSGIFYVN